MCALWSVGCFYGEQLIMKVNDFYSEEIMEIKFTISGNATEEEMQLKDACNNQSPVEVFGRWYAIQYFSHQFCNEYGNGGETYCLQLYPVKNDIAITPQKV